LKAGLNAEHQMSHYLKRAFADTQGILVLNGIRLESDNDSAQIDHLIIHKYGMIIIESKSVHGTIEINEHGEWHRLGFSEGMASPVEQAKRQAVFLKKYLNKSDLKRSSDSWLAIFDDSSLEKVSIDVLVAISDTGIIMRQTNMDKVYKADMITDKINQIIEHYQEQDGFFNLNTPLTLSIETRNEIGKFLVQNHTRLPIKHFGHNSTIPAPVVAKFHCLKCGSEDINILFGHTYYFKCKKCDENMPIPKENCPKCGQQLKLRKGGNQFYIECKPCGTSKLFFKNAS